jgi:hypothetical protein
MVFSALTKGFDIHHADICKIVKMQISIWSHHIDVFATNMELSQL